jgi:hypothetical protein
VEALVPSSVPALAALGLGTASMWSEPRRIWPASGLPGTVRAIIAVPLVLGLVALLVFMAINSSAQGCRPGWAPPTTTMTRVTVCQPVRVTVCQPVQEP